MIELTIESLLISARWLIMLEEEPFLKPIKLTLARGCQ
jgi:hypothetical protein